MCTLIIGGKIITMADPLYAQAVVVENGMIAAVGSETELLQKYHPQNRMDLNGAVLIPAFMDAHSHFTQTAYALLQADLSGRFKYAGDLAKNCRIYKRKPYKTG